MIATLNSIARNMGVELNTEPLPDGAILITGMLQVFYFPHSENRNIHVRGANISAQHVEPWRAVAFAFSCPPVIDKAERVCRGKRGRTIRQALLAKSNRCCWCNTPLNIDTATIEHVIPIRRGGTNQIANLRIACGKCNGARGGEMPELTGLHGYRRRIPWDYIPYTHSAVLRRCPIRRRFTAREIVDDCLADINATKPQAEIKRCDIHRILGALAVLGIVRVHSGFNNTPDNQYITGSLIEYSVTEVALGLSAWLN